MMTETPLIVEVHGIHVDPHPPQTSKPPKTLRIRCHASGGMGGHQLDLLISESAAERLREVIEKRLLAPDSR
jgi:hypothetical protein